MKHILLLLFLGGVVDYSSAQPGFLDSTFGDGGKAIIPTLFDANTACLQKDGKILSGGLGGPTSSTFAVVRHLHSGSEDSSFGENGIKVLTFPLYSGSSITGIAQLADGKILATGYGYIPASSKDNILIVRMLPDGSPDSSFGINGLAAADYGAYPRGTPFNMQLQSDGKIVIGGIVLINLEQGEFDYLIARFLPNGSKDSSFGTNGMTVSPRYPGGVLNMGLLILADGRIVQSGKNVGISDMFNMIGYTTNGNIDTNFGEDGYVETNLPGGNEYINELALQADGKIIAAGKGKFNGRGVGAQMTVARYNTDGTLDRTFGINGAAYIKFDVNNAEANSVAIQQDGKIVLTGKYYVGTRPDAYHFALARLTENGLPDSTFGISGKQITDWGEFSLSRKVLVQKDGKIISIGLREDPLYTFAMCRYDNDSVNTHPLYTKIRKWIRNHILNFQDANPNAAYYVIEQSNNATTGFTPIATIQQNAISNNYSYALPQLITSNQKPETIYYRIKSINKDNSISYSDAIADASTNQQINQSTVTIFPNPAKNTITIQSPTAVTVRLQNSNGLVLATQKINGSGSMDISKLKAGVYYVVDIETGTSYKVVKE